MQINTSMLLYTDAEAKGLAKLNNTIQLWLNGLEFDDLEQALSACFNDSWYACRMTLGKLTPAHGNIILEFGEAQRLSSLFRHLLSSQTDGDASIALEQIKPLLMDVSEIERNEQYAVTEVSNAA